MLPVMMTAVPLAQGYERNLIFEGLVTCVMIAAVLFAVGRASRRQ